MFDKFISTISNNYTSPLMIFDLHSLKMNIQRITDILNDIF